MLINCYYYAPHNHSMLTEHVIYDLDRMKEIGTNIVSVCVQESQLTNWHWKHLDNFIKLAHERDLKVHAIPNRWAGITAGWLDGFSSFSIRNTNLMVENEKGELEISGEMVSCINKPGVSEYLLKNLRIMLKSFEFDGLIWDEPHAEFCHCEFCRKKGIDSFEKAQDDFSSFIDMLSLEAKNLKNSFVVSAFVQPHHDELLKALLKTENIDYIGSDGHLRSPDHTMHRMKTTIFEAYDKYAPLLKNSGKKSFFLIEGQRHRDEDLENYLENLHQAFSLPMDLLMYYYTASEMSPEKDKIMTEATWLAVAALEKS